MLPHVLYSELNERPVLGTAVSGVLALGQLLPSPKEAVADPLQNISSLVGGVRLVQMLLSP